MRPPTDARHRLVAAADRLFYAGGVRAAGIDRVIAEAGVAKATLYAHFPSKDDLLLAVLEHREQQVDAYFSGAVARHREAGLDPVRALFAALKGWFSSEGFRGCFFQNTAAELADPSHPAAEFVRRHKQRLHQFFAGLVAEAAGPGADASAVVLLIEGAIITALIQGSPDSADDAERAALALFRVKNPQGAKD
jgi:AcrR family transcriptional regulator